MNAGGVSSPSSPSRYCRRQVVSRERDTPCRRAVDDTCRCPRKLSSTSRTLSASPQCRRRGPSAAERTSISGLNLWSAIRSDLSPASKSRQTASTGGIHFARDTKLTFSRRSGTMVWFECTTDSGRGIRMRKARTCPRLGAEGMREDAAGSATFPRGGPDAWMRGVRSVFDGCPTRGISHAPTWVQSKPALADAIGHPISGSLGSVLIPKCLKHRGPRYPRGIPSHRLV